MLDDNDLKDAIRSRADTRRLKAAVDPPEFQLTGRRTARLLESHDGDTIKVSIVLYGEVVKVSVRLLGIDAPEVRSRNDEERAAAVRARDFLAAWALPERFSAGHGYSEAELRQAYREEPVMLEVDFRGADKYGLRYLGRVHREDGSCLNDAMLRSGHARPYDGGAKQKFS